MAAGLLKSMTLFYSVLVSNSPTGKDGRTMGDSTGRRQPVHHNVSAIEGDSVVYRIEGEGTVGCRAHRSCYIQHSEIFRVPHRILYHKHVEQRHFGTWLV